MEKIRILHSGETTGALSGFGKYGREVLKRLVQNDRFQIAEFASFGSMEDNKFAHVKWRYYPNAVEGNHPLHGQYGANPANAFGVWRFENVCLDFKPHHVFDIRDPWMFDHVCRSPLRKFFYLSLMPTVDSAPQQPSWIENFKEADAIFTYSDWAIPVLSEQSGGDIQAICSTYPGVDLEVFQPRNKKEMKQTMGIPEDSYIIGMAARNQTRKLFAELFKMFRIYLDKYGDTDIGKKTYLYLHTSYPDVGWDIPELLNEFGITNRVYFSYICNYSKTPMCIKFESAKTYSSISNGITAQFPNVGMGYTEEQLANVYNIMDLYIQYANCEGSGMPQLEAAACGVPIAAIDYSAMGDVVEKTQGIKLKPASIPRDLQMGANRAVPDNFAAADSIYKFFSLDKKYKEKKGKIARQAAEKWFNWDRTAKIWSDHFENANLIGLQGKWDAPIQITDFNIPAEEPPNINNLRYIQWLAAVVAKNPSLAYKYFGLQWLNHLNLGFAIDGRRFDRNTAYEQFKVIGMNHIIAEKLRCGLEQIQTPDFIQFAHILEGNNV